MGVIMRWPWCAAFPSVQRVGRHPPAENRRRLRRQIVAIFEGIRSGTSHVLGEAVEARRTKTKLINDMKRMIRHICWHEIPSFASLGAALLFGATAEAQTWQTVDNAQVAPGLTARALAVGTDPGGTLLYSAGWSYLDANGTEAGVVRASADSGQTWATLDVWYPTNFWPICEYQAFCSAAPSAALPSGGLFTAGDICDSAGNLATIDWIVRRSTDGGSTWTLQDQVDSGAGGKAQCRAIQTAPSGEIWAAGLTGTNQGAGGWVWLVRKSGDGGNTWTTTDSLWGSSTREAKAIGFSPSGAVFVAGSVASVWTVRRSTDDGATWTTVDSYSANRLPSEACGIVIDAAGNIYVAGGAQASQRGSYSDIWVVRRSADGGNTWSTVDNLTLETFRNYHAPGGTASAITIAPSGELFVSGYLTATDGSLHWLARQGISGKRGAITWSTTDNYQMVSGEAARANYITSDAYGNVFAAGRAADSTAVDHWITRLLAP
jgi:hypothetical protein